MTLEVKEEMIRRYEGGASTVELEEAYGFTNVAIGRMLKRSGVQLRTPWQWNLTDHAAATRVCIKCRVEKPTEDYLKWTGITNPGNKTCASCRSAAKKVYHRKNRYGLSESDYADMVKAQGGTCAICKRKVETLCVDHDHRTGAVRGLLCRPCNTAIGQMEDNVKSLQSAIKYLKKHNQ